MKATRPTPPPFTPVTLTLESQHEVDAVFALLNHIKLSNAVGLGSEPSLILEQYSTRDYETHHEAICQLTNERPQPINYNLAMHNNPDVTRANKITMIKLVRTFAPSHRT